MLNAQILSTSFWSLFVLFLPTSPPKYTIKKKQSTKSRILPFKYSANTLLIFMAMAVLKYSTKSRIQPFKYLINTKIYPDDNITAKNF